MHHLFKILRNKKCFDNSIFYCFFGGKSNLYKYHIYGLLRIKRVFRVKKINKNKVRNRLLHYQYLKENIRFKEYFKSISIEVNSLFLGKNDKNNKNIAFKTGPKDTAIFFSLCCREDAFLWSREAFNMWFTAARLRRRQMRRIYPKTSGSSNRSNTLTSVSPSAPSIETSWLGLATKKETFLSKKTGPSIKSRNERLRQTCPSRGPSLQTTKGPPSAWLDAGLRLERIGKIQSTIWTPSACGKW